METMQIEKFLEVLFPQLTDSFIELRCIQPPDNIVSEFYPNIEALVKEMPQDIESQKGYNIYIGVCLRSRREGTKGAVKHVEHLWADIDWKDYSGGKVEALQRLMEFPLPPTAIVCSGHGYQPYWCLKEAAMINNPDDVIRVETYLKRLTIALGADLHAAEIARVLRLPGTYNLKDSSNPVLVDILHIDESLQYNLSDFGPFLPDLSTSTKSSNPPGWISQSLADLHDGNRNGTFAKITGRLHNDGWPPDDILCLLTPHAERCKFPIDELRREIEGITQRYPPNKSFPSSPYNSGKKETEPLKAVLLSQFLGSEEHNLIWRIDRMLPEEGVGILAGPAGYGKSWMTLDGAIECSIGGKWLGYFATTQCRVLYLDEESSSALLRKRLKKLLRAKELQETELDLHFCVGQGICLTDSGSVERIRNLISTLRPGLVIVDSLIRVHRAEENSATEMARVFAVVKDLVREFSCSFLFADHQRKPNGFGTSLDLLLRGSSEKVAFVDTLLSLHRKENTLIVEHSKSRYDEAVSAFTISITDPTPETTVVAYTGEAEVLKQQARQEAAREFIMSVLNADEWLARKVLVEQAKDTDLSEKVLDATLKSLEAEGKVDRENRKPESGPGGKAAFYRLKINSSQPLIRNEII